MIIKNIMKKCYYLLLYIFSSKLQ